MTPALELLPYQRVWLADRRRRKLCVKARRIGMSTASTLDFALDAAGMDPIAGSYEPASGVDAVFISTGERFAAKLLKMALTHLRALEATLGDRVVETASEQRVRLRNGREILSLPGGNPSAIHGYGGNVLVDEAARVPNISEMMAAAMPVAGVSMARPQGYRMAVISTPGAPQGPFYELAETPAGEAWSIHRIDVHEAVRQGFKLDVEAERRTVGDALIWASQYELQWVSEGSYIDPAVYDACAVPRTELPTAEPTLHGYDVGRTQDASALVSGFRGQDDVLHVSRAEAHRGMGWAAQRQWLERVLAVPGAKLALDRTGIGHQLAEELEQRHGSAVTPVHFTSELKEQVYGALQARFANGSIRVPDDDGDLRRDVLSLRRELLPSGATRIVAPRVASGHADRATAIALLCWLARRATLQAPRVTPIRGPRGPRLGREFRRSF